MIRREQATIASELLEMGIEELLAACQALILYMLMRIAHGPSTNDADADLCKTLTRVCFRMPTLPDYQQQLDGLSLWRRWVLIESKRRVNSVVRLMWQLYHLDVGVACPCVNAFTATPLPASKRLWGASSEAEWQLELARDGFYSSLRQQDLMNFRGSPGDEYPSKEEWARWYAGADELGILVVISTGLL
jgi:hypothetical protein